MEVKVLGISNEVKPVPLKALLPIEVTLLPIVSLVSELLATNGAIPFDEAKV